MKPLRIRLRHVTLGYPMRIELMIAESQPAVLPLNYGHHIETHYCYLALALVLESRRIMCFYMVGAQRIEL